MTSIPTPQDETEHHITVLALTWALRSVCIDGEAICNVDLMRVFMLLLTAEATNVLNRYHVQSMPTNTLHNIELAEIRFDEILDLIAKVCCKFLVNYCKQI